MSMSAGFYRELFDLSGRVAIVTGAAGVLGPRFSAALADHGASIALVDLDEDRARQAAVDISARFGVETLPVQCDVARESSVVQMIRIVESELGAVDILVNNAATKTADLSAFFAPATTASLSTWREVMAVNLDGMFLVAREAGSRMVERRRGSIVQTASIYGALGPDQRIYEGSWYLEHQISTPAVYSASKAGVLGLTRHLATEWAHAGVRVNALVPGGVRSGQNETFVERYGSRVPLGRMASPDEMAGAIVYLASDASSYVTGQALMVDGGLSAW